MSSSGGAFARRIAAIAAGNVRGASVAGITTPSTVAGELPSSAMDDSLTPLAVYVALEVLGARSPNLDSAV